MENQELLQMIRSGDSDAFRQLYRQYLSDVYSACQEAGLSAEDTREVIKAVFIRVYKEITMSDGELAPDSLISIVTAESIAGILTKSAPEPTQEQTPAVSHPRSITPSHSTASIRKEDASPAKEEKAVSAGGIVAIVFACLFFVAALWLLLGVLMSLGVLPTVDLGYTAFDKALFPIFFLSR